MALSGLDIYKLLPKTNCRKCGFATCLAFAMQLAKKAMTIETCPYVSAEAKAILEVSAQPPIRLVTVGTGEAAVSVGNETVLFRHEEKFHHPCALGFIIDDTLPPEDIRGRLKAIDGLRFERVGQVLAVNLVAVRQQGDARRFAAAVKTVSASTTLGLVLMSNDPRAMKEALLVAKTRNPLVYAATAENISWVAPLVKEFRCPLVVSAPDLEALARLTAELSGQGITDLVLDTGRKPIGEKLWEFTQLRRLALKKSNRSFGYPLLAVAEQDCPYEEAMEAATYIAKYAGIILVRHAGSPAVLAQLTLRQNIFTDPQKPLQIEPKLYAVGQVSGASPVMVTTNFSLTYYTVLGEVEASKVPSYILSVDTEGMSVLTAWAAEKFNPDSIARAMEKNKVSDTVAHTRLIIPGYVAVISGELEERSGWQILVGPKEAAGLPSFLKNL